MKKYKEHIKKHWYCFLLAPIFMTLEAAGEFILPFINANIIDQGAASGDIPYILENGFYMLLIAAAMLAFGVLGAFFAVRGSARVAAGVRRDAFARIQTFSFSDIDRFSTGSLITRVTNDITQVQTFLQTLMRGFFRSPVMLVGALVMSFQLNAEIAGHVLSAECGNRHGDSDRSAISGNRHLSHHQNRIPALYRHAGADRHAEYRNRRDDHQ